MEVTMGLDQYLCERRLGINSEERQGQLVYWRKANQVHKWFSELSLRKSGEELDNCEDLIVTIEDLKELRDLCIAVLADKSKAEEHLPTQTGFFFGSQAYGDWYFGQLEETVEGINRVLEDESDFEDGFIYYAWW
jgi:hypothetical protein